MAYTKFCGSYRSSNHKSRIQYYIFEPETDFRAVVQFTHGWKDCIERNQELISFFTDHGIMVCGCDFIGHGKSSDKETQGDLDKEHGWSYMVKDVRRLTNFMKKEYPNVPVFLYGHGMGSLVARLVCAGSDAYDGVIFSGTSGKQKFCRRCVLFSGLLRRLKGWDYRSETLEGMIYQRLNRKFWREGDKFSWFSASKLKRDQYRNHDCCKPVYTISAYENMFKMTSMVSASRWYRSVKEDLPILLISGVEDPVGNFGKGVRSVYEKLEKSHTDVELYLYEDVRHDIQGDDRNLRIFQDILHWMKQYMDE